MPIKSFFDEKKCLECNKKTKSYGRRKEQILKEFENDKI